jgi:Tol biopolymer transport system component/DNA-binding winged helix-turn-helix (wHTH) protein
VTAQPVSPTTYEFGRYRLAVEDRLLLREGIPVALFPKAFDILVVLVESGGRLVTKEELLRRVWPDTFVQDANLSQNIHVLRKALDDESFIETVPRQGYRFTANVSYPEREPEVVVTRRSTTHVVLEEVTDENETPRGHRRAMLVVVAICSLAIAGAIVWSRSASRAPRGLAGPVARASMTRLERLTTDSRSYEPAISPDGRFVAYQVADSGQQTVWLKNIATGSAVQILPRSAGGYSSLNFSRDGNEILYKTGTPDHGTVLRVPLFGGAPREVARNVWSDFSLSPDGREIAFVRPNAAKQSELVATGIAGGDERVIATLVEQQNWLEVANTSPSWSPDGTRLVICGAWREPARGFTFGLYEVAAKGGALRRMPSPPWNRLSQAAWLGDGSAVVVVGRKHQREPYQLWLIEQPSGTARRLTNDLNDYNKVRVSADSQLIAVEQQLAFHELWTVEVARVDAAKQISHGARSLDGYYGLSWTPDGRLLFTSSRSGESEIYTCNPDGTDLRQLTRDSREWNTNARMTADGRFIVFSSGRNGEANIWRMNADGSNVVHLTRGKSEFSPTLTPDGQWVYYVNAHVAPSRIERVPIGGGQPEVVFQGASAEVPVISPDGRSLAFNLYSERTGWRAAMIPIEGGRPRLFGWSGVRGFLRWTPDSRGLLFMKAEGNVSNVWLQPLDGSEPRAVTRFKEHFIWNFAPSPDGKQIALSRGSDVSDIVLLRDFR